MTDDRAAVVQRFYESLGSRDWEAMRGLFADDAVLGVSGRSSFAGLHRGGDAGVSVFRDLVERSSDTLRPVRDQTWDICTSDHHVILLEWFQAKLGADELQAYLYFVTVIENGRIARMFVHSSEQYEFDAFFA